MTKRGYVYTDEERARRRIAMRIAMRKHRKITEASRKLIVRQLGLRRLPPVCAYDEDEESPPTMVKQMFRECPFLADCRALPVDSPVLCELSDVEAQIVKFSGLLTAPNK